MSTSSINPFKYLVNYSHDEYAQYADYFILRPHQTIPKYYLFANKKLNKLLLHYSMGSGKSASAIFAFLHYLNHNIKKTFNNKFLYPNIDIKIKPNIFVVASWMTWQQIDTELISHPEFGVITNEQRNILSELERSGIESNRTKEKLKKKEIITKIRKYIKYIGYQGFFNLLFPEKNIAKYGQNIDSLVEEYKNGTLVPSKSFIRSLENTIIVVDEMQKLYSSMGLNTYGFAVAYIAKHAEEYKCKIIFLTGTMINSSIGEIPDILNVLADEKKWIDRDDFCEQETILDDVPIWKFKKGAEDRSIEYLKDRFLYYDQKTDTTGSKPEILPISKMPSELYFPNEKDIAKCEDKTYKQMKKCQFITDNMNVIQYNKFDMLPREHHIGNRLISGINIDQPLILYGIKVKGFQKDAYDAYLQSKTANITDDESEMSISIHDAVLPPSNKFVEYGIYKQDNIFRGSFLSLSTIGNYSAIGFEMCCLCMLNAFAGEKTVLYHNKLNSFGIKQYAAILNYNGFIKFGNNPVRDSICKSCRRKYSDHSLSLEERLKLKVCNEFKPLVYDYLTGDLDTSERMYIVKEVYNNPMNLSGDMISALFISDVAYAGVNLLSTHNIIFLSKVSNISKWKQIYNRIVRVNSHALFPEEKQYVKIYTFVIEGSKEHSELLKGGSPLDTKQQEDETEHKQNEESSLEDGTETKRQEESSLDTAETKRQEESLLGDEIEQEIKSSYITGYKQNEQSSLEDETITKQDNEELSLDMRNTTHNGELETKSLLDETATKQEMKLSLDTTEQKQNEKSSLNIIYATHDEESKMKSSSSDTSDEESKIKSTLKDEAEMKQDDEESKMKSTLRDEVEPKMKLSSLDTSDEESKINSTLNETEQKHEESSLEDEADRESKIKSTLKDEAEMKQDDKESKMKSSSSDTSDEESKMKSSSLDTSDEESKIKSTLEDKTETKRDDRETEMEQYGGYQMIQPIKDKYLSNEEKYYKRNIILNVDIIAYTNNLAKKSISETLFNNPEKLALTLSKELAVIFVHDIENELNVIVKRSTPTYTASEWELNTYIQRLKDKKYSLSFIDFSLFTDDYMKRLLQRNKNITTLQYTATKATFIRIEQKRVISQYQAYNTISYNQLKHLENKKNTLQSLLKDLQKERSIAKKCIILYNICKLYSGRFEELKEINLFWENIYEIGDEYYEDDETNFFFNHSSKNRSPAKMKGFYYGNNIVLRDGEMKRISIKYLTIAGIDKYPYVYRIVSIPDKGIIGESSPFYLHLKILKKTDEELIDRRKQLSGVTCFTMDIGEVEKYFPKIKIPSDIGYKREFCKELMFVLCEEQFKTKERFVYSPFEHY